jgi:hypothetical protein
MVDMAAGSLSDQSRDIYSPAELTTPKCYMNPGNTKRLTIQKT